MGRLISSLLFVELELMEGATFEYLYNFGSSITMVGLQSYS